MSDYFICIVLCIHCLFKAVKFSPSEICCSMGLGFRKPSSILTVFLLWETLLLNLLKNFDHVCNELNFLCFYLCLCECIFPFSAFFSLFSNSPIIFLRDVYNVSCFQLHLHLWACDFTVEKERISLSLGEKFKKFTLSAQLL